MIEASVICRIALARDHGAIRDIVAAAFGRAAEADLVDALRARGDLVLEAVAEHGPSLCAHIAYSRARLDGDCASLRCTLLAPEAVRPDRQRQGVGTLLVRRSLEWLRGGREDLVLVLGSPEYYSRFGFTAERARAIDAPWSGPSFMAAALSSRVPRAPAGKLECPAPFTHIR